MNPFLKIAWQKCADFIFGRRFISILIGLGLLLRLKYYFENLSFWLDEAWVALDITYRSFLEILLALNRDLSIAPTPIGFLLLGKSIAVIFGGSELSLRLIPLLFSVCSVFLFFVLAKKYVSSQVVPVAMALFALAGPLIYYSAQLKPYSYDVLLAIVLLLFADHVRAPHFKADRAILFGLIGVGLLWFSYGALFVLAGTLGTLFVSGLIRGQREQCIFLGRVIGLVILGFGMLYFIEIIRIGRNNTLSSMWQNAFMPWPVGSWASLGWLREAFFSMFREVLGLAWAPLAAGVFIVGAVTVFRKDRETAVLLLSPLALALGAAMAHQYPFFGRLILFSAPALIILLAEGMWAVATKFLKHSTLVLGLLAAIVLFSPLRNAVDVLARSHAFEEMRPVMRYLGDRYRPGDAVYFNNSAQYAFGYYKDYHGTNIQPPLAGVFFDKMSPAARFDPADGVRYVHFGRGPDDPGWVAWCWRGEIHELIKECWQQMRYNKRTWLIFSHVYPSAERPVLDFFGREGKKIEEFHSPGAVIYLYDLSRS